METLNIYPALVRRFKNADTAILLSALIDRPELCDKWMPLPDKEIARITGLDTTRQMAAIDELRRHNLLQIQNLETANFRRFLLSKDAAAQITAKLNSEPDEAICRKSDLADYFETVLEGLRRRMNLVILPEEQMWLDAAVYAQVNGYSAAEFLETYDLLYRAAWRKGRLKPEIVKNHLHELERLRTEDINGQRPSNGKRTNAVIAEEYRQWMERNLGIKR